MHLGSCAGLLGLLVPVQNDLTMNIRLLKMSYSSA